MQRTRFLSLRVNKRNQKQFPTGWNSKHCGEKKAEARLTVVITLCNIQWLEFSVMVWEIKQLEFDSQRSVKFMSPLMFDNLL
jgi:hypothetical protein